MRFSTMWIGLAALVAAQVACADTNAPAFRFHPELADMAHGIFKPTVLTNSALLGMTVPEASNHFARTGFCWQTDDVARVETGFIRFPRRTDYIWHRNLILTFAEGKIIKVEVVDRPAGEVVIEEKEP